jgi:hypothetical protein
MNLSTPEKTEGIFWLQTVPFGHDLPRLVEIASIDEEVRKVVQHADILRLGFPGFLNQSKRSIRISHPGPSQRLKTDHVRKFGSSERLSRMELTQLFDHLQGLIRSVPFEQGRRLE